MIVNVTDCVCDVDNVIILVIMLVDMIMIETLN